MIQSAAAAQILWQGELEDYTICVAEKLALEQATELEEIYKLPDISYVRAYYKFLRECYIPDAVMEQQFMLAFIDADDIPELLFFYDYAHFAGVRVYTYVQDRIVELGEFGSLGAMLYTEYEGIICSSFIGHGEFICAYFRIENGELEQLAVLDDCTESPYTEENYLIDEIPVDKQAYDAKWEELNEGYEYIYAGYGNGIPVNENLADSLSLAMKSL